MSNAIASDAMDAMEIIWFVRPIEVPNVDPISMSKREVIRPCVWGLSLDNVNARITSVPFFSLSELMDNSVFNVI